jgi:hypothetical protein
VEISKSDLLTTLARIAYRAQVGRFADTTAFRDALLPFAG